MVHEDHRMVYLEAPFFYYVHHQAAPQKRHLLQSKTDVSVYVRALLGSHRQVYHNYRKLALPQKADGHRYKRMSNCLVGRSSLVTL